MPMPRAEAGVERARVNAELLRFAVRVVQSREGLNQNQVARGAGVRADVISALIRHGQCPPAVDVLALCAWMHLDPDLVMFPPEPKAAPAKAPAAA